MSDAAAPPHLVIFDCDGVLVDSEALANRVLGEMLGEQGLPTSTEQARAAYRGLLLSEVAERAGARLGRALPDGWLEQYEHRRSEVFRAELRAVDGAAEVLALLASEGIDVCVASQGRLAKTALSLELTGLERFLPRERRFSAEEVPRGKPHPDLFLHAARSLGVAPLDCAVVEDTAIGVRAAVAAGMRSFGYAADGDAGELRAAGAQTLGSLRELPARLGVRPCRAV